MEPDSYGAWLHQVQNAASTPLAHAEV
jgi:hypothetical protein